MNNELSQITKILVIAVPFGFAIGLFLRIFFRKAHLHLMKMPKNSAGRFSFCSDYFLLFFSIFCFIKDLYFCAILFLLFFCLEIHVMLTKLPGRNGGEEET